MVDLSFSQVAAMNEHFVLHTFSSFLDSAERNGIHKIELWAGLPHLYAPDTTPQKVNDIARQLRRRQMELICYTPEQCVYPFNIAAKDPELWKYSLEYFLRNLEIAGALEAPMFQIVPGWGLRTEPRQEALKRSLESVGVICRAAERLGIRVVLEALEEEESNLIRTAAELREAIDQVGAKNLGAIVDTCPMAAAGEDFEASYRVLGDKLWHTHFIDSVHQAWGDGVFPLERWLRQLDEHRYEGILTMEILNDRYLLDPSSALEKSARALRSLLS